MRETRQESFRGFSQLLQENSEIETHSGSQILPLKSLPVHYPLTTIQLDASIAYDTDSIIR